MLGALDSGLGAPFNYISGIQIAFYRSHDSHIRHAKSAVSEYLLFRVGYNTGEGAKFCEAVML